MRLLPTTTVHGSVTGDRECYTLTDTDCSGAYFRKTPLARMPAGLCRVGNLKFRSFLMLPLVLVTISSKVHSHRFDGMPVS